MLPEKSREIGMFRSETLCAFTIWPRSQPPAGDRVLEAATEEHLFNELLSIDGAPGPDSYPLSGCGNTEVSTGSPADRADERSWAEDNFAWLGDLWEGIWDVLKWILLALIIIWVTIFLTIFTLGTALPTWFGAIAKYSRSELR
jgi:hypothetical protein